MLLPRARLRDYSNAHTIQYYYIVLRPSSHAPAQCHREVYTVHDPRGTYRVRSARYIPHTARLVNGNRTRLRTRPPSRGPRHVDRGLGNRA